MERVAGDQDFFLWEKDEHVAISVGAAEPEDFNRARFAVKHQMIEGHGRQSDLHALELDEIGLSFGKSFWIEALLSEVGAFCRSAFSCSIWAGMVTISCFTRGMPRCSMLVRVASEEMISTPAGQELGYASLPW